jgi:alpha-mannosidase
MELVNMKLWQSDIVTSIQVGINFIVQLAAIKGGVAWLWPYGETRRKVTRSWVTQCA